ncbi:Ger(x)C family spore germination protein [Paenibacillus sp. 1P07SE]|uniref:Ger(x)C family spore germination protein n=1 Tax=Paenibacillus sp. 1P07SE TaxID=3132209 RepID=UPI0039A53C4C
MRSHSIVRPVLALCALLLLTGCWNKYELTDWIFVQAAAIDKTEDDKIRLTTYFYRPTGGTNEEGGAAPINSAYASVQTEAKTLHEAVRDILMHAGRKAQWSHMRVILIGEPLAKERNIKEILDFFARDHEPRGTVSIQITNGAASPYLNKKPLIEQTLGQEFKHSEAETQRFAGKSLSSTLLELSIQLLSESNVGVLPYVYNDKLNPTILTVGGVALLRDGKLKKVLPADTGTEALLMLMNKYKEGVIEYTCEDKADRQGTESFEVTRFQSKIRPVLKGNEVSVVISVKAEGIIGELRCSQLITPEDEQAITLKIQKTIEAQMKETMQLLQKQKLDAIGIANKIYARHPYKWKKLKPEWEQRFAELSVDYDIKVKISGTGMNTGKPFGE